MRRGPTQQRHLLQHFHGHAAAVTPTPSAAAPATSPVTAPAAAPGLPASDGVSVHGQPLHGARAVVWQRGQHALRAVHAGEAARAHDLRKVAGGGLQLQVRQL